MEAEMRLRTSLRTATSPSKHARAQFDSLDKEKLREVLSAEQRHLCIYCERELKDGGEPHRIEHWRPVSRSPSLALHWKNLYLSCASKDTCDGSKADQRLVWRDEDKDEDAKKDLPWPSDANYEEWIGFTSDGIAYVRADAPLDEARRKALELALADQEDEGQTRTSFLNLNSYSLAEARRAVIDVERERLARAFRGRTATDAERRASAQSLLAESRYRCFISVRVAYLHRLLGKNRGTGR
ncbi:retron system putative HNH endonuclease [Cystobacter fuscus]|uniref:retron system putative HNH endonuclease n=1 Tax=Cystobacter fuscus TaxID=43 RepID=UPI0037C0D427